MAWCPHCQQDRPIQRQTFDGVCKYCGDRGHRKGCRGPVPGALDVCTYCSTPLFAKAPDKRTHAMFEQIESQNKASGCFVVTAAMGDEGHPTVADMRLFRDRVLTRTWWGRAFIGWYCARGPALAAVVARRRAFRALAYAAIVVPAHAVAKAMLWFSERRRGGTRAGIEPRR